MKIYSLSHPTEVEKLAPKITELMELRAKVNGSCSRMEWDVKKMATFIARREDLESVRLAEVLGELPTGAMEYWEKLVEKPKKLNKDLTNRIAYYVKTMGDPVTPPYFATDEKMRLKAEKQYGKIMNIAISLRLAYEEMKECHDRIDLAFQGYLELTDEKVKSRVITDEHLIGEKVIRKYEKQEIYPYDYFRRANQHPTEPYIEKDDDEDE